MGGLERCELSAETICNEVTDAQRLVKRIEIRIILIEILFNELSPETHKGLKRVTLICFLCPVLVIIRFRKYHIWKEKKR